MLEYGLPLSGLLLHKGTKPRSTRSHACGELPTKAQVWREPSTALPGELVEVYTFQLGSLCPLSVLLKSLQVP